MGGNRYSRRASLHDSAYSDVQVLDAGVRGWMAAGLETAAGLEKCLVKANDVVLSPSIRGNKEDMQKLFGLGAEAEALTLGIGSPAADSAVALIPAE